MPECPPTGKERWYTAGQDRWGRQHALWAEKFFDTVGEAHDYYEGARQAGRRVYPPMRSHEDPNIWAVCGEPQ
jgi:hypothetical protein